MKKYIIGFLSGASITFVIMRFIIEEIQINNARLFNENIELKKHEAKLQYKLDKANEYIKTVTSNFTYYRIKTDKELEDLGKWEVE